jgi:putative oxidoreductase
MLSGFQKLAEFSGTVASEGLPLPLIAAMVAVLGECVGGLLLIVGYQTRLTGIVMALWCIVTALVAHRNFGNQDQMIPFPEECRHGGRLLAACRLRGEWLEPRCAAQHSRATSGMSVPCGVKKQTLLIQTILMFLFATSIKARSFSATKARRG